MTQPSEDLGAMFRAAEAGDLAQLQRLLAKDPALARSTFQYRSALAFAVRANQVDAAVLLLERGADPLNSGTSDSLIQMARDRGYDAMVRLLRTVLIGPGDAPSGGEVAAAIRARDLTLVRRLLDSDPTLVSARDESTNQPIHWAVMTRQLGLIDELLARGASIEAQRADGARPIQLTNGDYNYRGWRDVPREGTPPPLDVLAHLRARGAHCDICTAAHIGDLEQVRRLLAEDPGLANRPSPYVTYYACSGTPLRNAAGGGHLAIVRLLLEHGADPNLPEEGIAPLGHALHAAACNGHAEIVRVLLEHGAHPNVPIDSSADTLSAALARGDQTMIDLLCSHGAARSLELLAYYGDVQTAAAVLAANPALANDATALENAAGEGHEPFVRLLLRCAPDLPTQVSCGAKTTALTDLLFAHGMDPNRADWLGVTALHRFAASGDLERATLFLDRGADPNARDAEFRSTPLGYAARCGRREMAELLLDRGAERSLPDDPPWATPRAWAERRGHTALAGLL